ncbi:hypothetical protein Tco_0277335 [Tanacetum coccineum]
MSQTTLWLFKSLLEVNVVLLPHFIIPKKECCEENVNVKGKEIEYVDLILRDESCKEDVKCKKNEYIRLNGFNKFYKDEIKCGGTGMKVNGSADSQVFVIEVDEFLDYLNEVEIELVYECKGCVKGGGNGLEIVVDKWVNQNDESLSFDKELDLWKYEKHNESLVENGKEYNGEQDGRKENDEFVLCDLRMEKNKTHSWWSNHTVDPHNASAYVTMNISKMKLATKHFKLELLPKTCYSVGSIWKGVNLVGKCHELRCVEDQESENKNGHDVFACDFVSAYDSDVGDFPWINDTGKMIVAIENEMRSGEVAADVSKYVLIDIFSEIYEGTCRNVWKLEGGYNQSTPSLKCNNELYMVVESVAKTTRTSYASLVSDLSNNKVNFRVFETGIPTSDKADVQVSMSSILEANGYVYGLVMKRGKLALVEYDGESLEPRMSAFDSGVKLQEHIPVAKYVHIINLCTIAPRAVSCVKLSDNQVEKGFDAFNNELYMVVESVSKTTCTSYV